jgi:hypothetical protein
MSGKRPNGLNAVVASKSCRSTSKRRKGSCASTTCRCLPIWKSFSTANGLEAYSAFERYDLEAPDAGTHLTYAELAAELGVTVTDVTNYLAAARRQFRAFVLERLRELTGSDDEFRAEAKRWLGVDV